MEAPDVYWAVILEGRDAIIKNVVPDTVELGQLLKLDLLDLETEGCIDVLLREAGSRQQDTDKLRLCSCIDDGLFDRGAPSRGEHGFGRSPQSRRRAHGRHRSPRILRDRERGCTLDLLSGVHQVEVVFETVDVGDDRGRRGVAHADAGAVGRVVQGAGTDVAEGSRCDLRHGFEGAQIVRGGNLARKGRHALNI